MFRNLLKTALRNIWRHKAQSGVNILGLSGPGHSNALAEVCVATVLAGELSIIGAFCSGDFAMAHHALSRGTALKRSQTND